MSKVYTVVLMSRKWYAIEHDDIREITEHISEHVDNGNIVAICDDLETFKDEMELDSEHLIIVDPNEEDN